MMKTYLFLLLLCVQGAFAQVEFRAVPAKTSIGINEVLSVEFTVNGDGDNFEMPSYKGFVLNGVSDMYRDQWKNRKHTMVKSYTLMLKPTAKGTFTIGSASIEVDGKVYRTAPFRVKVGNAVAQPAGGNRSFNPFDPLAPIARQQPQQAAPQGGGIYLVADISKTNPYVNEPVTVVYKLYFNEYMDIRGSKETSSPTYNDFWSQNIPYKGPQVQDAVYKGENYRCAVVRQAVLYPQKSGKLEIEPLTLEMDFAAPTGKFDMMGRAIYASATKVLSAGKKTINVKALPGAGRPADFGNAVGGLSFSVTPNKTTLRNGEPLELTVKASGNGNLKLFKLPKPVVPAALEMYDPEHKEDIDVTLNGMEGTVSDVYTIVPSAKGKYLIKGLTFSYFDPANGKYISVTSDDILLNVPDGPATAQKDATGMAGNDANTTQPFRFIALETTLQHIGKEPFLGSTLFWILLAAPFLIIPLVVLFRRRKEAIERDVTGNRIRRNNKLARRYLGDAKRQLGNKEPFYIALEKALHNFLKAKLNIETSEMSKDRIRELLLERHADETTVNKFIALMDSCEFARYAPSSGTAMQQDYDSAVALITALEKQV